MDKPHLTLAAALAQATELMNRPRTLPATLDAFVDATRLSLPEFAHVSITRRGPGGRLETRAGTDELVWELDAIQYDLGEGPCVQANEADPVVVVRHLKTELRWPQYIPAAAARGVRSQVGVRLFAQGEHIGGLNLYSTEHDEVDEDCPETARLFATHAAIVLGHAQQEDQLNQALQSRTLIGQAMGILMERFHIDEDRAFGFLTRVSSTSNIKLRDVAAEVLADNSERYRSAD